MIDVISAPTHLNPVQDIKIVYEVKQFEPDKNYL
jgi:hypothetical protein